MVEITVLHSTYNLKGDSRPYYVLFKDVRGNYFQPIFGYIKLYELSKNEEYFNKAKNQAQIAHFKFNNIINDVLMIMKEEKVEGILLILIKRLEKASNFDWTNLRRFDKFDKVYIKILEELNRLG